MSTHDSAPTNVVPLPRSFQMYRLYDIRRNLLYVGITQQMPPNKRYAQHARDKYWWDSVVYDQMITLRTDDRTTAEKLERLAILAERPRFNVIHQEKRARFAWAGHGFQCGSCDSLAHIVIADQDGYWSATCLDHQPDEDAPDLFNFLARRVSSSADLSLMVHHLSTKSWFNFDRFVTFLTQNHHVEAC